MCALYATHVNSSIQNINRIPSVQNDPEKAPLHLHDSNVPYSFTLHVAPFKHGFFLHSSLLKISRNN